MKIYYYIFCHVYQKLFQIEWKWNRIFFEICIFLHFAFFESNKRNVDRSVSFVTDTHIFSSSKFLFYLTCIFSETTIHEDVRRDNSFGNLGEWYDEISENWKWAEERTTDGIYIKVTTWRKRLRDKKGRSFSRDSFRRERDWFIARLANVAIPLRDCDFETTLPGSSCLRTLWITLSSW